MATLLQYIQVPAVVLEPRRRELTEPEELLELLKPIDLSPQLIPGHSKCVCGEPNGHARHYGIGTLSYQCECGFFVSTWRGMKQHLKRMKKILGSPRPELREPLIPRFYLSHLQKSLEGEVIESVPREKKRSRRRPWTRVNYVLGIKGKDYRERPFYIRCMRGCSWIGEAGRCPVVEPMIYRDLAQAVYYTNYYCDHKEGPFPKKYATPGPTVIKIGERINLAKKWRRGLWKWDG